MNTIKKLVVIILAIVLIVAAFLYTNQNNKKANMTPKRDDIACTQEVKQCPNGGYVARVAPSCEFEECPGESDANKDVVRP